MPTLAVFPETRDIDSGSSTTGGEKEAFEMQSQEMKPSTEDYLTRLSTAPPSSSSWIPLLTYQILSANLCRWVLDFKHLTLGKQIGAGSYGLVYKAKWKGVEVAVKRFIQQKLSERQMLEFRAEVAFLAEMHHPNIILFIGACLKKPNLCLGRLSQSTRSVPHPLSAVTEYLKRGSLKVGIIPTFLLLKKKKLTPVPQIRTCCRTKQSNCPGNARRR